MALFVSFVLSITTRSSYRTFTFTFVFYYLPRPYGNWNWKTLNINLLIILMDNIKFISYSSFSLIAIPKMNWNANLVNIFNPTRVYSPQLKSWNAFLNIAIKNWTFYYNFNTLTVFAICCMTKKYSKQTN